MELGILKLCVAEVEVKVNVILNVTPLLKSKIGNIFQKQNSSFNLQLPNQNLKYNFVLLINFYNA